MAELDPRIPLGVNLLNATQPGEIALQTAMNVGKLQQLPLQNQLLQGRAALQGQQLDLGAQKLEAGQRDAQSAKLEQQLIKSQTVINSFDQGDSDGAIRGITNMFAGDPERQRQELIEFNDNPASYIGQAKAELSAFRQQQGGGATAGQREFAALAQGLPAGDVLKARRIKLGLDAKASAGDIQQIDIGGVPHLFDRVTQTVTPVKVKGGEVTTETVAKRKGTIKAAEDAAKAAIKLSTESFKRLEPLQQNLVNIDDAIRAIDEGAQTGAIVSRLPSIRKSSIELDTIQKKLGLDVISSTTFGALSEGEREFALSTALPKNLQPADLKLWLQRKRETQEKLINQLQAAATFLGTPGNTIVDFIELQKLQDLQAGAQQPAATAQTLEPQQAPQVGGESFELPGIPGVQIRKIR